MSQSYEAQGLIHSIGETTEYGKNGFTKREFVIELTGEGENGDYPNHIALELIKDKCGLIDGYNVGDEITAHFNLSGRLWSGNGRPEKCFTSLQVWRLESLASAPAAGAPAAAAPVASADAPPPDAYDQSAADFDDDIPF